MSNMKIPNGAADVPSFAGMIRKSPIADFPKGCCDGLQFRQVLVEKPGACRVGLAGNAGNPAACAVVMAKENRSADTHSGRHIMMDSQSV